jgi:hypothetical protein
MVMNRQKNREIKRYLLMHPVSLFVSKILNRIGECFFWLHHRQVEIIFEDVNDVEAK